MTRGVLYIVWSTKPEDRARITALLDRSEKSLSRHHPELPVKTIWLDDTATLLDKSRMFDLSPFDTTLFLDLDTVVMGDLSYGFDAADKFGLAACICEAPWARRHSGLRGRGDLREWNTGVLFWTKQARPVFDRWKALAPDLDSSILFNGSRGLSRMPYNDQASFSAAVDETGFNPFALPLNFNLRPLWHKTFFGPVRVWHDYQPPPAAISEWNEAQTREGAVLDFVRLT